MRADPRALIVLGAALGAGVATGTDWWTVAWTDAGTAGSAGGEVGLSGVAGTGGLLLLLPGVALAGVLLTLTLQRLGRRIVGGLVALVGLGMMALGITPGAPASDVITAAAPWAMLAEEVTVTPTAMPLLYVGAGALVALAGGWLAWRPPAVRRAGVQRAGTANVTDALASWKAMDDGDDPTDEGERP
ncbi:MAG: Trp biosynthesis-associated membrane protein [Propionibacteriaceae bacterium]|nr:Trp biosynthesis-associated membrane protein [Propionibacteriaceae bacterium]